MITIENVSILLQRRTCGKAHCQKCKEGKRHGPYYYAYKTYNNRVYSMYIGRLMPVNMQPIYEKLAAKIERITGI